MTDTSTYGGLFSDPPFISSDPDPQKTDPYDKQDCIPSRYLGKGMSTHVSSSGPFLTLASAEQNAEVFARNDKSARLRAAAEAKRAPKPVSDSEFRYTSFPSKSTGPGSYYGCFQSRPFEHDVDPMANATKQERRAAEKRQKAAAAAEEEERRIRALPNIKTNPPKKGTYGYVGTLLSAEPYNDNWRADREADEKGQRKAAAADVTAKPLAGTFRVPGVNKAFFDELAATGVSGVYSSFTPPEETGRQGRKRKSQKQAAEVPSLHEKPFYSGKPKGGDKGCLNPFPNTWVDPREEEAAAAGKARRRKTEGKGPAQPSRPTGAGEWKPNSFGHTSVISSCLRRFY